MVAVDRFRSTTGALIIAIAMLGPTATGAAQLQPVVTEKDHRAYSAGPRRQGKVAYRSQRYCPRAWPLCGTTRGHARCDSGRRPFRASERRTLAGWRGPIPRNNDPAVDRELPAQG